MFCNYVYAVHCMLYVFVTLYVCCISYLVFVYVCCNIATLYMYVCLYSGEHVCRPSLLCNPCLWLKLIIIIIIIFLRARHFFSLFLCFIFIAHFFVGLREPWKYFFKLSFYAFTLFSNNSLISWWILTKLVSTLLPSILYLSYYFQPEVSTWMYLRKAITLQTDSCHNLDPFQMICISFEILSVYWCITL